MSTRRGRKQGQDDAQHDGRFDDGGATGGMAGGDGEDGYTGRYVVLLREGSEEQAAAMLRDTAGIAAATIRDDAPAAETAESVSSGSAIFPHIGAAVIEADPEQAAALGASTLGERDDLIEAMEPERIVHAFDDFPEFDEVPPEGGVAAPPTNRLAGYTPEFDLTDPPELGTIPELDEPEARGSIRVQGAYLRGLRDGMNTVVDRLLAAAPDGALLEADEAAVLPAAWSETVATWGLQATRVIRSAATGRGIRVAVLDTGFGPHPDFAGRPVLAQSFVPGESAADGHGHGTHCIGTACGPRRARRGPRYGVAWQSTILSGKVLSNAGSGRDAWILAGINWAVAQRAAVVSMSLGARVAPGTPPNAVYDGVALRALRAGTLIIAAAGNDSSRPGTIRPVSHPANCRHILAVGALDPRLLVADFSNGGLNPSGGEVNIAAPGVDVHSSWPRAPFYRRLNGTSMATPHVAGIAALYAQQTGHRGLALWWTIARNARRLAGRPARDVGVGLVQAR